MSTCLNCKAECERLDIRTRKTRKYCSHACYIAVLRDDNKLESDFWKKVNKTDGCWLWLGKPSKCGYGKVCYKKRHYRAHRLAWQLVNGKIPANLLVCHSCDNPICVRPDHLFLGSQQDNMTDKVAKNRQAKANTHGTKTKPESVRRGKEHWSRLYPEKTAKGERNGSARLTNIQVQAIRQEYIPGKVGFHRLAKKYGVSKPTIRRIIEGVTWK